MSHKIIITEGQFKRLNSSLSLLNEQKSQEEIKAEFQKKIPCFDPYYGKFFEENGKYYHSHYNSQLEGKIKTNVDGSFEIIDGPYRKYKGKRVCKNGKAESQLFGRAPIEREFEKNQSQYPCFPKKGKDYSLSKNKNKELLIGYEWENGIAWHNAKQKTYFVKGGKYHGQSGTFSCNGTEINYNTTNSATTKVNNKYVPKFINVTDNNTIERGMRDHRFTGEIYKIQEKLKELRHYRETPDGLFGKKTEEAVKKYQSSKGIRPSGKIDQKTMDELVKDGVGS